MQLINIFLFSLLQKGKRYPNNMNLIHVFIPKLKVATLILKILHLISIRLMKFMN